MKITADSIADGHQERAAISYLSSLIVNYSSDARTMRDLIYFLSFSTVRCTSI